MDGSGLGYCILGVAGRLLEELGKKKIVQGRSWNGYCQFPTLGRDLVWRSRHAEVAIGSGVATWSARWAEMTSRHGFDVATWATVWEVTTWKRCRNIG